MPTSDPAEEPTDAREGARDEVELLVEEFFEQRRSGATPDASAFARRVPGRDAEFLELVETLGVLERAANVVGRTPLEAAGRLGRFKLLRLVGRGGMGSVYEAIDEAAGDGHRRHVALKVLPLHSSLDEREVARFRREAEAVARLDHPHIVPLLGFGEEQGTHWLAMQFVPGASLDRADAPRLAPQEVARHGKALAEALACAHAQGVLHRDVKPSNVLLDASGTVWITDFGLAKSEGAATLTRAGETVGTPRYMAPEAFLGFADPRTDVWGVGATLYELLAGRPAFAATSRAELSRQISDVEPPPLRRVDAALPADLATIVHKCLQKEPAARYPSARELADDLGRFLAGTPIRARPPSFGQRVAARLAIVARRHRGVAVAAVAVLVVVAVLAWLYGVSVHRHNVRLEAANSRAEANLGVASAAIGTLLEEVTSETLSRAPALDPLRRKVLTAALGFELQLLAQQQDDPEKRLDVADAHVRVGFVNWELGQLDVARDHLREAAARLRTLVAERPGEAAPALLLARALEVDALVARQRGDVATAEAALREGRELLHAVIGDDPKDACAAQQLLSTATLLGDVVARARRPLEGAAIVRATLARVAGVLEGADVPVAARRCLRNGHYWLSWIVEQTGPLEESVAGLQRALAVAHELAALPDPDVNDVELDASYRSQLANALHVLRRDDLARPLADAALADLEAIVLRWPMSLGFRLDLASALSQHASITHACDPAADVAPTARRAVALAQACVAEAPDDVEALDRLLSAQFALAVARDDAGDAAAALELLTQTMELAEARLSRPSAWCVSLVDVAALVSVNRAIVASRRKEWATAREAYARARALTDWLLAGEGSHRTARTLRLQIVLEEAALWNDEGRTDEALAAWGEVEAGARALLGGDLAAAARDATRLGDADLLVRALNLDANVRAARGDADVAARRLGEAIVVAGAFAAAWPDRTDFAAALGTAHADLSNLAYRAGDAARARGELLVALDLLDGAVVKEPLQPLWRRRLAWVLDHLAGALDPSTELAPIVARVVVAADHAPADAAVQLEAARVLARAADLRHGELEKRVSPLAAHDAWADAAMERLQGAVRAGFADARRLESDTAFDLLRGRRDFAALLESLGASGR